MADIRHPADDPRTSVVETGGQHGAGGQEHAHDAVEHERPEDWGWHHDWRRSSQVVGWVMVVALLLLLIGHSPSWTEALWLIGLAAIMAGMLIRVRINQKNAWRS